jgi:hypothetical protein
VAAKIKAHNPDFQGKVNRKIEDGVVTELIVFGGDMTDLSPVRALIGLRSFSCDQKDSSHRILSDLSPLKDMKLTSLAMRFMPVTDLAPLKDMKLTSLALITTRVTDLSPLRDNTTILALNLGGSPVSDTRSNLRIGIEGERSLPEGKRSESNDDPASGETRKKPEYPDHGKTSLLGVQMTRERSLEPQPTHAAPGGHSSTSKWSASVPTTHMHVRTGKID